jgi:predicted Zn-dependent protease
MICIKKLIVRNVISSIRESLENRHKKIEDYIRIKLKNEKDEFDSCIKLKIKKYNRVNIENIIFLIEKEKAFWIDFGM